MVFSQFKRFEFLVSLGCIVLLGYFVWQAQRGNRGVAYNQTIMSQVKKLSVDLEVAKAKHTALEDRVAELRPDSIDPDLLDEMARKSLNYGTSSEIIVHFRN